MQVKAGLQLPRLYGAESGRIADMARAGWVAGLEALSPLGPSFALKHEALIASQKKESRLDVFPVSVTYRKYGLGVFAGPYMGILLRSGNYGDGTMQSGYASKNDLGLTIGAGYTFCKRIAVEVRYVRGFVPPEENAGAKEQLKAYRQYVSFTLGYVLF